jgi:hypothetical protein
MDDYRALARTNDLVNEFSFLFARNNALDLLDSA